MMIEIKLKTKILFVVNFIDALFELGAYANLKVKIIKNLKRYMY
jgi:hypothetical protein